MLTSAHTKYIYITWKPDDVHAKCGFFFLLLVCMFVFIMPFPFCIHGPNFFCFIQMGLFMCGSMCRSWYAKYSFCENNFINICKRVVKKEQSEWVGLYLPTPKHIYSKRMLLFSLAYLHLHNRYCRLSSKHFGCIKCHMIAYFLFFFSIFTSPPASFGKEERKNQCQANAKNSGCDTITEKTKKENKSFCFLIKLYHSVDTISQAQANRNCNI